MRKMNYVDWVAFILVMVGGLNWGLFGLFQKDIVAEIFGGYTTTLARIVYALIGLATLYTLALGFMMMGAGKDKKKK